jgi:5'-deoxynucleotidase YfbR-like HD superfamily hydrolase
VSILGDLWIETYTGQKFYPLQPEVDKIKIEDIAHALSYTARFNGHGRHFYSVAQHSINVRNEVMRLGGDIETQLIALLHDGSEAYIADLVTPVKVQIPQYREIESVLQQVIWKSLNISPTHEQLELVKKVDKDILKLEAKNIMNCIEWKIENSYLCDMQEKGEDISHIYLKQKPFSYIKALFLQIFNNLIKSRP